VLQPEPGRPRTTGGSQNTGDQVKYNLDLRNISPGITTPSKPDRMSRIGGLRIVVMLLSAVKGFNIEPIVGCSDARAPRPTTRKSLNITPNSRALMDSSPRLRHVTASGEMVANHIPSNEVLQSQLKIKAVITRATFHGDRYRGFAIINFFRFR
jgi:hypothetical protein